MSTSVQVNSKPNLDLPSKPISDPTASGTKTPGQNATKDDDSDEHDIPTINDVDSLREGIIKTSKNKAQSPYTILLVGETGVGKSSVLEFIANVVAGNDTDHYDFNILDHSNEEGGSGKGSQTNEAHIYNFTSKNGILLRILDTPGLADTRGLQKDEEHKRSIATQIQLHIASVNAVLILANGTVPRITVGTDYALSTLSALFPKTLAQNIAFLFTNVSSPLSWNFAQDTIPAVLEHAPQYLLDNPIALQKKYLKIKSDPKAKNVKDMHKAVKAGEEKALEMLVDFFDWLDGLKPQPTTEILSLYEKSQDIEAKIANTLAQMTQATNKKIDIDTLTPIFNKTSIDVDAFSNYKRIVESFIWKQVPTTNHNTLCSQTNCYSNCHENCALGFSIDPKGLKGCAAMSGEKCDKCGHSLWDHHHYKVKWDYQPDKQVSVDEDMEKKWEKAKNDKERQAVFISESQKTLEQLNHVIDNATKELAQLAEDYAGLSLSGSFSSQVEKAVYLLSQSYQGMKDKGVDKEQLDKVKGSLDAMEKKLNLLKEAQKQRAGIGSKVKNFVQNVLTGTS